MPLVYHGELPDLTLDYQPTGLSVPPEFSQHVDPNITEAAEHMMSNVEQLGYHDQMLAIDPMLEDLDTSMNVAGDPVHPLQLDSANLAASYPSGPQQPSHPSSVPQDTAYTPISPAPILARPPSQTPPSLPCACVANHYLITSRLHSVSETSTTTTAIAQRLSIYRDALHTAENILNCTHCPGSQMTGSHNVMMLLSLLSGIGMAYQKLCNEVRQAAEQFISQEEEIDFQLVELQQQHAEPVSEKSLGVTDLHNQTPNGTEHAQANRGQGGLAISLTVATWRDLVLTAINREIFVSETAPPVAPPHQPLNPNPEIDADPAFPTTRTPSRLTLEGLIIMMEARQKHRHATMTPDVGEQARKRCEEDDFACLKMLGYVRSIVDGLKDNRSDFVSEISDEPRTNHS